MEELHSFQISLVAERLRKDELQIGRSIERIFYHLVPERFSLIRPYKGTRQAIEAIRQRGITITALSDMPPQNKFEIPRP